jgi:hypothetical protein
MGQRMPAVYAGIALTTLASLLLELSLTRIFSVVFYYHFAFLAISIALFGLGAGGVLSYFNSNPLRVFTVVGWLAAACGPLVALSLALILTQTANLNAPVLIAVYFAAAAPFILAGAIISSVIAETARFVHRVYFFDLLGAAAGCLLLIPLLDRFGGINAVLTAGTLFACASVIWFSIAGAGGSRIMAGSIAVAMMAWMAYNQRSHILDIRFAKGAPIEHEAFVQWNSFSRIGVLEKNPQGFRDIKIDSDADTVMGAIDLDHVPPEYIRELRHTGPGFAYILRPGAKTLVIGAGGGLDVERALYSGSRDVTAVEINPIIANTVMREKYVNENHGLYLRPEVRLVVEDGRSFVRRTREKYDVITATLVDTWASTAAGAFALTENNLYTTDAFRDYLAHLNDRGLVAFTRWGFDPPRESLRLVSLANQALLELGEKQPWRHVMVVRSMTDQLHDFGALDTVLISRRPFSRDDVSRAFIEAKEQQYEALYLPGDQPRNPFGAFLRSPHPDQFASGYTYDITPVTDDRPFFFFSVQPRDAFKLSSMIATSQGDYKLNRAVPLLFEVTGVSVLATLLVLALPPLLLRSRLPGEPRARAFLLYFACLGVAYILVQIALIQKFVLLLGHPTYSLTVVIFSMLASSSAGSFASHRLAAASDVRWGAVLGMTGALLAILALLLGPLTSVAVAWPLPLKVAVAALVTGCAGFPMGMAFPTGLSRLAERYPAAVRWAWSLNAAASVMGSAAAICLGIYGGLRFSLLVGAALYWAALGFARFSKPSSSLAAAEA